MIVLVLSPSFSETQLQQHASNGKGIVLLYVLSVFIIIEILIHIMDYLNSLVSSALGRPDVADITKKVNPLTYPKSSEAFSKELFKNPTSEYRGCPLWAWNTKLKKEQLMRQIDNFADMGMGGFHMHVRTGLDTEYLGSEFMDIVLSCVEYAESKNMMACL